MHRDAARCWAQARTARAALHLRTSSKHALSLGAHAAGRQSSTCNSRGGMRAAPGGCWHHCAAGWGRCTAGGLRCRRRRSCCLDCLPSCRCCWGSPPAAAEAWGCRHRRRCRDVAPMMPPWRQSGLPPAPSQLLPLKGQHQAAALQSHRAPHQQQLQLQHLPGPQPAAPAPPPAAAPCGPAVTAPRVWCGRQDATWAHAGLLPPQHNDVHARHTDVRATA